MSVPHSAAPVTRPPRRRRALRLTAQAAMAAALAAGTLAACTPAPDPDPALVELLREAQADSRALGASAPAVAELRTEHAGELDAEIQRVCGFTDDGALPESCVLSLPEIAAAPTDDVRGRITGSQQFILDRLDTIPGDSVGLLTTQYIEQARFLGDVPEDAGDTGDEVPEVPAELELSEAELAGARELLEREYAAAWALGTALAYVDTGDADILAAIDGHRERAGLLREITATAEHPAPEAAAGYTGELPELSDHASAIELIMKVQDNARESWHAAATSATDPQWRILATRTAGDTARDLAGLGGN